ncbi:MAG: extracellular solute-binding protein [Gammaproteobacteria bacterium]|nr:extracellular solute-binding protein [Gammaproteobacteria bacterium]
MGYSNVYNLTRPQLKQVKDKLLEFNRQAATYYAGGGDEIKLALQGEVVAFNGWYDPSAQLKAKGKNFKMIIPKEGAVGMFDSYMIAADRGHSDYENEPVGKDGVDRHQLIAHQYINHQISPEVQKEMAEITGLSPANIETLPLLSREQIIELHLNEPDYFDRMLLWDHMPRKNLYLQLLDEVRADWKAQAQ